MATLTYSHKKLLAMQSNLDQMAAAIQRALDDPRCDDIRIDIDELQKMNRHMTSVVEDALQSLTNNF